MQIENCNERNFELFPSSPSVMRQMPKSQQKRKRKLKRKVLWHRVIFFLFCVWVCVHVSVYFVRKAVANDGMVAVQDEQILVHEPYQKIVEFQTLAHEPCEIEEIYEPVIFERAYELLIFEKVHGSVEEPQQYEPEIVYEVVVEEVVTEPPIVLEFPRVSLTASQVRYLEYLTTGEADGEDFLGQVAVASVFINRMKRNSSEFGGGTFEGVFNHPGGFSPVIDGVVFLQGTPVTCERVTDSVRDAVQAALNGYDPTGGALFFYNPQKVSQRQRWLRHMVTDYTVIGNHWFYRYWPPHTISFEEWQQMNS